MDTGVLQTAGYFCRQNIAGDADHEEFSQADVEDPLGRHARIAAAKDGCERLLALCESSQRFRVKTGEANLTAKKAFISGDEPCERFIRGGAGIMRQCSHCELPFQ